MSTFAVENYEPVCGEKLTFYKLCNNGTFQIDEFEQKLTNRESKSFRSIISYMDIMAENDRLLPDTIFKKIKGIDSHKVYEYRKDNIRVYVLKQAPHVIVILGGYKTKQTKNIKQVTRIVNALNLEELL